MCGVLRPAVPALADTGPKPDFMLASAPCFSPGLLRKAGRMVGWRSLHPQALRPHITPQWRTKFLTA
jgi:hypothetical protein